MASRGTGSHLDSDKTTCTQPNYDCFESTRVLVCGYPAEEVQEIKKTIEEGGGNVHTKRAKTWIPQVVVCGSAADKTYKDIRRQPGGSEVPAVTKQWVEECNRAKGQVSYQRFQLKALTGLIISITNFNVVERGILQQLIEQHGGTYSAELYKGRCTHLICKTATGNKYRAALDWKTLHVISEAWIHATIKLGYPAPEESYQPASGQALATATSAPAAAAATLAAPARAVTAPAVLPSIQGGYTNSNDSWAAASSGGSAVVQASGGQLQQQQQQEPGAAAGQAASGRATRASTRSRVSAGAAGAAEAPAAPAGPADPANLHSTQHQQQQQLLPQQQQQQAAVEQPAQSVDPGQALADRFAPLYDEGLLFLERVQLWWCGIAAAEQAELRHMLFAFGGVWMPRLNENVTHIMIGSQATSAELSEVKQYLQTCNRKIDVVSPGWLQLCMSERQYVTDSRGRMTLGALLNPSAGGAAAAVGAAAATDSNPAASTAAGNVLGGVFAQTASRSGFPDADQQQQQQGEWVPEYWLHQPRDPTKVFEGCHFTLAALKGRQREHEDALEKIRAYGGQIFNHGSTKPPPRWPTKFAVCSNSLTPAEERQLLATDSSFREVHPSCRITVDWLVGCLQKRELVRVDPLHTPLFCPTRHALPLPGFEKLTVAVSGYDPERRNTITRLAGLLGAKVVDKLNKVRPPTHLIIPRWGPDSADAQQQQAQQTLDKLGDLQIQKIRFAQRHSVQMVDSFWLVECLTDGRRVGEEFSRPLGDVSLLLAATGATQAGGPSQLPQTQADTGRVPTAASRQGSTAAAQGGRCPVPSNPAAAVSTDPAAGTNAGDNRPSNWFAAGANRTSQQQQQQQQSFQSQQQQQQQRPVEAVQQQQAQQQTEDRHLGRRSLRKLLGSPGGADVEAAAVPQQQQQQHHQQQAGLGRQPLQDQQQFSNSNSNACTVVATAAGAAVFADVGNMLQSSPPGVASKVVDPPSALAAPSVAVAAAAAVATSAAGVQPATAVPVGSAVVAAGGPQAAAAGIAKAGALLLGGSDGDEDHALTHIMENLRAIDQTIASKPGVVDGSCASQSVPDMPSLQELTGRIGSGGAAAAAGSSGGTAGVSGGYSLRGKRKALGGTVSSGTAGSGSSAEPVADGLEADGGLGSVAGPAGIAKRPRRSGSAPAGAMPPPPARSAAKGAAAGAGARGSGGSRYCPKKGTAVQEPVQMSQQVDYDVGQHPEALLAAAGKRRSQTAAAADEKAKSNMLARLGQLTKRQF